MPRIFHVTFTREFQCSIVAESEAELDAALESQDHEFDEWADQDKWEYQITDHLRMVKQIGQPSMIPKEFKEPDMGVEDGECVNIYDYAKSHPGYLDLVNAEATEVARQITLDKLTPKLFPED
jgi:hypothetical protein